MIDFIIDYLILVLGIPLQFFGIIAAFFLKGQKVPALFSLIFLSSVMLLFTLSGFLAIEAGAFSDIFLVVHLDYDELLTIIFGLWAFGMAGQLIGLLVICLRFKKQAERLIELEEIATLQFSK